MLDKEKYPFGKLAGDNKCGWIECPTCGEKPQKVEGFDGDFFGFRDKLSAKEYGISGMCQTCQDKIFGA
jgi:hypothetical protein